MSMSLAKGAVCSVHHEMKTSLISLKLVLFVMKVNSFVNLDVFTYGGYKLSM